MSCEIPVRIYNRVSSKSDRQKQLLFKTVSFNNNPRIQQFKLLVYVQRYVQHMKNVKYPTTSWEGLSELCLSFVD